VLPDISFLRFILLWHCHLESKRDRIALMKTAILKFPISLLIVCLGPLYHARAVSPPPDGGYPGYNTAEGDNALASLTTGIWNTAIGESALYGNTTGQSNTALGRAALSSNNGNTNTAIGWQTLSSNRSGEGNTAIGGDALFYYTTGSFNTATGFFALLGPKLFSGEEGTGSYNTANGAAALNANTSGSLNTATGVNALQGNTTGSENTANGFGALASNNDGAANTAMGTEALLDNTSGIYNMAGGIWALLRNTTGNFNTADGAGALLGNTTGSSNIALGALAGFNLTTGDNNIDVGNEGVAAEANTIRIGTPFDPGSGTGQNTVFIAGIIDTSLDNGVPVVVDTATGQLGVLPSSLRFKTDIKPMDKASEAILALKPVTFCYQNSKVGTSQFGLIAEEVAKIDPNLILRDSAGRPYTVRYDAVNAMLLNEFLKEHKTVLDQGATIARLEKQIETLTSGLQKVSAQLEVSKSAPLTVGNHQ
jgi:trimeric autotransporter adhesin